MHFSPSGWVVFLCGFLNGNTKKIGVVSKSTMEGIMPKQSMNPVIPFEVMIPKRGDRSQVLAEIVSIIEKAPPSKWAAADEARMVYLNTYADLFGSMVEDNNI